GETRYKTSGNRVEDLHEDDRYRPGLLQQRRQNRRAGGKNDVRRERNQFGSIFADPHRVARGPTDVDLQVATLAPTELLKSLAKCCQSAQRLLVIVSPRQQHADPPHALGLLRPHSERPRRRPAEKRDEIATRHSITSSARASSVGGTSRPRALAVFRLITSSNFVGCSTGRSAGFVPCKILCTNAALRRYMCGMSAPWFAARWTSSRRSSHPARWPPGTTAQFSAAQAKLTVRTMN